MLPSAFFKSTTFQSEFWCQGLGKAEAAKGSFWKEVLWMAQKAVQVISNIILNLVVGASVVVGVRRVKVWYSGAVLFTDWIRNRAGLSLAEIDSWGGVRPVRTGWTGWTSWAVRASWMVWTGWTGWTITLWATPTKIDRLGLLITWINFHVNYWKLSRRGLSDRLNW